MLTRRSVFVLLAQPMLHRKLAVIPAASPAAADRSIREAAAELAQLIRPRPKIFLHYHLNSFDIWVAASYLKITIRKAGFPLCWLHHYRTACAVARDMEHAEWECYEGCRHNRAHEFAEGLIDSGEEWRYETEILS